MEWGLGKVLPRTTKTKRIEFATHIIPVIAELCSRKMEEGERRIFLAALAERIVDPPSGA